MKHSACIAAFLAIALPSLTLAQNYDFCIEEPELLRLPKAVERIIHDKNQFYNISYINSCTLAGKRLRIGGSSGYAVTTLNACGWEARNGPLWVIKNDAIILETVSACVTVEKHVSHGVHDITTTNGNGGPQIRETYGFTGKNYKRIEYYNF